MDKDELRELGDTYGRVMNCNIWDDKTNECKAGELQFNTREEAMKGLSDLNDRRMDGWEKKITACLEQKDV